MLHDDVPPTPGTRKLLGVCAESQRFLINFEPVMGEHSVAALTKNSTKFPTKFPTKEGQRAPQNVQTPAESLRDFPTSETHTLLSARQKEIENWSDLN